MIVIVAAPYIGFPYGMAATSRVTAYARGLADAGEDVRVVLLGPSEIDEATAVNTEASGCHQGIPFEYLSVSTVKSASFVVRKWRFVRAMFMARRRIRELGARDGVGAVLLYGRSPWGAAFFRRVSRGVGATFVVDLAEMPYHEAEPGPRRDKRQARFGRRFIGPVDLVIAISSYLAEYANRYIGPAGKVVLLPIMVDCDEFRPLARSELRRAVTYAGILNERKDGVRTLMRAYAQVADEFPDTLLRLVGDSYDPVGASNIPEFTRFATELGIVDRVEFVGQVSRAEIPGYLAEAYVLALARPSSQQADAGLPTKLGEYLAVGRPVVVTCTSDIGAYLSDGVSAYLAPPDDVDAFAARLRDALAHPQEAESIGAAGRASAEQHFDYRACGRVLAGAIGSRRAAARETS